MSEGKHYQNLVSEIASVINRHCAENGSNTPDFILAEYLRGCLDAFEMATLRREDWYGHRHSPGRMTVDGVDELIAHIAEEPLDET